MEEKEVLKFYDELVRLLNREPKVGDTLFEELANAMLMGHEFGDISLCSPDFYEIVLLYNILSINNKGEKDELDLTPFNIINESYYESILRENLVQNIFTYRRLMFIEKATDDIINCPDSFTYNLIENFRPEYNDLLKEFSKIKTILRNGWIKRKVDPKHHENDATHSIQMLALANICFMLYPLDHLNKQRIYEMIIIHEIAETIVGDIVENSAEHLTKSQKERIAVQTIFANLKYKQYFLDLWEEFECHETEEAKLAYELDKIDPVLKARFLDKELKRDDLFDDFYDYEDTRGTFIDTPLQKLFYSDMC